MSSLRLEALLEALGGGEVITAAGALAMCRRSDGWRRR